MSNASGFLNEMIFREKQQIIICVAAVIMTASFVLFRYLPLNKEIKAAKQIRAAQLLSVAEAASQTKQLPLLKEQLIELQNTVGDYEKQIPASRDLGEFLQKMAGLMDDNQLEDQLTQPGAETKADISNCIPVNIQCKGSLKNLFEFYKQLQNMDRLVRIEKVELVNDSDLGGQVSMKTKMIVFYRS